MGYRQRNLLRYFSIVGIDRGRHCEFCDKRSDPARHLINTVKLWMIDENEQPLPHQDKHHNYILKSDDGPISVAVQDYKPSMGTWHLDPWLCGACIKKHTGNPVYITYLDIEYFPKFQQKQQEILISQFRQMHERGIITQQELQRKTEGIGIIPMPLGETVNQVEQQCRPLPPDSELFDTEPTLLAELLEERSVISYFVPEVMSTPKTPS